MSGVCNLGYAQTESDTLQIIEPSTVLSHTVPVLSDSLFDDIGVIFLSDFDGWKYTTNDSLSFKEGEYDDRHWEQLNPADISLEDHKNNNDYIKGWFRFRFQLDSTLTSQTLYLRLGTWGAAEVYVDGILQGTFGQVSDRDKEFINYNPLNVIPDEFVSDFVPGETYTLALRLEDRHTVWLFEYLGIDYRIDPWVRITSSAYGKYIQQTSQFSVAFAYSISAALIIILILISAIYALNRFDPVLRDAAIFVGIMLLTAVPEFLNVTFLENLIQYVLVSEIGNVALHLVFGWIPMILSGILFGSRPSWIKWLVILAFPTALIVSFGDLIIYSNTYLISCTLAAIWIIFRGRANIKGENTILLFAIIAELLIIIAFIFLEPYYNSIRTSGAADAHIFVIYLFFPLMLVIYLAVRYTRNYKLLQDKFKEISRLSEEKLNAEREKQRLATKQKEVLEKEVEIRTADLQQSLENLRAAQQQLVQQEKLASLGQLTAGIAHEIKNPLNFVNNFSSVSLELIDEALDEIEKLEKNEVTEDIDEILKSVKANLTKIHDHGSRADRIVKSMLLHSRGGSGKLETVDFNAIIQEYTNLAFHGMRAGKNPISVDIQLDLDSSIGKVSLITEDFSRVILNLCNNAFDALRERQAASSEQKEKKFDAKLVIKTELDGGSVRLFIEDNGPGIPSDIIDKILQPFFTTKKGTEGTGLGLSITNDIIKAHGGQLDVESEVGTMTRFIITLPKQ
jgi:signal transduction histidine kinase